MTLRAIRKDRLSCCTLGLLLSLIGCATVRHGRTQDVSVSSDPEGAQIFAVKDLVGVTPTRITLKRNASHLVLRFEKQGYQAEQVTLKRTASGWLAGDLGWSASQFANQGITSASQRLGAAAGVAAITLGIDFATGSAYKLPAHVRATLKPLQDR